MRVKRPHFLTIRFDKREDVDLYALLGGEIRRTVREEPVASTLLDRTLHVLQPEELQALARLAAGWVNLHAHEPAADRPILRALARRGVLLSDGAGKLAAERRRRDELLAQSGWHAAAAVYHYTSRWQGAATHLSFELLPGPIQTVSDHVALRFEEAAQTYGPPPGHFHERGDRHAFIELPRTRARGPLHDVLAARRSTRLYEREAMLPLGTLSTILRTVFGAHGQARLSRDMVVLRKTSPSAGGLHPIEVYPVVRRVEGLTPGLYHYSVKHHGLELLRAMDTRAVGTWIDQALAGQSYFATAHVAFILAARFYRTFWKYRHHAKAYRAIVLDAAHLTQTLFLVAAELGLGAFITAAFNEVEVEEALGLDPYVEGPIVVCGTGVRLAEGDGMTLAVDPYEP